MLTRRSFSGLAFGASLWPTRAISAEPFPALSAQIADLERGSGGGRLGIAAHDTRSGRFFEHRADERFALTSTFKMLAAAAVLAHVDAGRLSLAQAIDYSAADLVTYSPVTKDFAGRGMTLEAICETAVTLSDNTAGNLQLRAIGGPQGLTAFCRRIGDDKTRLDRWETDLNEAAPGDERDTTTPRAMLADLGKIAFGDVLTPASREKLVGWLKGCKTGNERMRAKLPAGWVVGDKTGAGERGTINDVGIIWPPDGAPILLAIYFTGSTKPLPDRAAVVQEVGRLVGLAARG